MLIEKLNAALSDPVRENGIERGRGLSLRDAADLAIEWLEPFTT
jgi:hypothetical protein